MGARPVRLRPDVTLGCWARRDDHPTSVWAESPSPYAGACGDEPASDLGLCAHHLAAIFPPGVRCAT